jgi:hypothetical protein
MSIWANKHKHKASNANFTFMWPCIVTNFFVIKQTSCTNFTNLFWRETLHVSDISSVHHQEFIHCTLSNGICIQVCRQLSSRTSRSCSKAVYKSVWHILIPLLSLQWINSWLWTEELSETCRVSWQNKFVKLVHLVSFIIKKLVLRFKLTYRTSRMQSATKVSARCHTYPSFCFAWNIFTILEKLIINPIQVSSSHFVDRFVFLFNRYLLRIIIMN